MLQGVKIKHVLEVKAKLMLNTVVRKTELFQFGTLDCRDEVAKIVNYAHAYELQGFEIVETEDELVEMFEHLSARWLRDHPALCVLFFKNAGIDGQVLKSRRISLELHLTCQAF